MSTGARSAGPGAVRVVLLPPAGGGAADAADPGPLVVDPEVAASLRHLDPERAVLEAGGDPPVSDRVLLLPPVPAAGGALRREVVVAGWRFEVEVEPAARAALRERARRGRQEAGQSGPTEVRAIIPGVIVAISVVAGDEVVRGQQLLAVEAMKMQNELRAPRDGTIERVTVAPGRRVELGDLLLVIT